MGRLRGSGEVARGGARTGPTPHRELGIELIVLYKVVKAAAELAAALALVVLASSGEITVLRDVAHQLRTNFASRSSILLGRALGALVTERGFHLLEIGVALDAVVSAVEGWSLWRGFRWAEWLVVAATATPLPLELFEIARRFNAWRVGITLVNLAVVVYLARRLAARRHSASDPPTTGR